jgi:hypothetical protein
MKDMLLQEDIIQRIMNDYPAVPDRVEIINLFQSISPETINVGVDQLLRSVLVIAAGDIIEVKQIFNSGFYGDPRDVIMIAEAKAGYPGTYGSLAFQ